MAVAMLRGVNLAGHQMIKMPALKTLCTSLGLRDVQTYIQSGNIIFREDKEDPSALARRLEAKDRSRVRLSTSRHRAHGF